MPRDVRADLSFRREVAELRQMVSVRLGASSMVAEAVIRDARLDEVLSSGDQAIAQGAVVRFRTFLVPVIEDADAASVVDDEQGLDWNVYCIRQSTDGRFMELMTKRVSLPPEPTFGTTQPPGAPIGVRVRNGSDEFTVHWHPPYGGDPRIVGYEFSVDLGVAWEPIPEDELIGRGTPSLSFLVNDESSTLVVENGNEYPVVLRSVAEVEGERTNSIPSNIVYGRPVAQPPPPPVATVPDAPVAPVLEVLGSSSIRVTWVEPDDGGDEILHYDVRYRIGQGAYVERLAVTSLTVILGGLDGSTRYEVAVSATNSVGKSGYGASAFAMTTTAATAPARPARPMVTVLTATSILVEWSAPNSGGSLITGYRVRYRVGLASYTFQELTGSARSVTLQNLSADSEYQISVQAFNVVGTSLYSLTASATTPAVSTVPSQPAAPTLEVLSHTSIRVTWVAPADGGSDITGYRVQFRISTGSFGTLVLEAAARTVDLDGLVASSSYIVRVIAVNAIGQSSPSDTARAMTFATPVVQTVPGQVSRPTISNIGQTSMRVNWAAPNDGNSDITGYTVQYRIGGGSYVERSASASSRSRTLTGLSPGTTYTIRVFATNGIGPGSPSSTVTGTTSAADTVPGQVARPTISGITQTGMTVSWVAPDSGGRTITGYTVQYRIGTGSYTNRSVGGSVRSLALSGLSAGTTYNVRVFATNGIGSGSPSSSVSGTTAAGDTVPGRVAQPSITNIMHNSLRVNWSAPNDGGSAITGYTVQYRTGSAAYINRTTGASARSLTLPGLQAETSYTVRVFATNGIGNGSPSVTRTASTLVEPPSPPSSSSWNSYNPDVLTGGVTFLRPAVPSGYTNPRFQFQVSTSSSFSSLLVNQTYSLPQASARTSILVNGRREYWVRGRYLTNEGNSAWTTKLLPRS